MANPSKAKGSKAEKEAAAYLSLVLAREVERRTTEGRNDRGDLSNVPNWVLEVKATKEIDLAKARKEAEQEAKNAGVERYASIHKKRQAQVKDWYVEMPFWLFAQLLKETLQ